MTATLTVTTAHRAARNQASIDLADAGAEAACIRLYSAAGGALLAVRRLAAPCGTLTAEGRIALQSAAANDLVLATGAATWAEWCSGDGAAIAAGAVTDAAGDGPFKLAGASGAMIYEGGLVLLASPALLG